MKRVRLPVVSRDARKLARRLEPSREEGGLYLLEACRGLECWVCVFHEPPRIIVEMRTVNDPLSSLRMRLPVVRAEYCGRTVWRSRWRRGQLVVDSVDCPRIADGCVRLWGETLCGADPGRILRERCGVGDAGRGHRPQS